MQPLRILKITVILLILFVVALFIPGVADRVTSWLETIPYWGALGFGGLCLLCAFFLRSIERSASPDLERDLQDARVIGYVLLILLVGGLVLSGASSLAEEEFRSTALQAAILWSIAWFMAGFLIGFLFGVPKIITESSPTVTTVGAPSSTNPAQGYAQRPNTNLEQISDWLTKIIVGIGLVELKQVPGHLNNASEWVAQSLSGAASPSQAAVSFAGSLIMYFSIVGFLGGYLLTLLFLAGAFGRAGRKAYSNTAEYGEDDLSQNIRSFWRPEGGSVDPDNAKQLSQWIRKNLPEGTTVTDLISTKELEGARKKAVAELRIK